MGSGGAALKTAFSAASFVSALANLVPGAACGIETCTAGRGNATCNRSIAFAAACKSISLAAGRPASVSSGSMGIDNSVRSGNNCDVARENIY